MKMVGDNYDYDFKEQIECIKDELLRLKDIQNSLSEHRAQYRLFANEIGLKQDSLFGCIEVYERTILIDIYSLSEQLLKVLYYDLLCCNNEYVSQYVECKLDEKKFSPDSRFENMQKRISKELVSGFRFVVRKSYEKVRKYDEMIEARHTYAHRGRYVFNSLDYEDVINVIEYIESELSMLHNEDVMFRIDFQKHVLTISRKIDEASSLIDKYMQNRHLELKKSINRVVKEMRFVCQSFEKKFAQYMRCQLLTDYYSSVTRIAHLDLRRSEELFACVQSIQRIQNNMMINK